MAIGSPQKARRPADGFLLGACLPKTLPGTGSVSLPLSVCIEPVSVHPASIDFDVLFKNTAIGQYRFFTCCICFIAYHKQFGYPHSFGVLNMESEHFLCVTLSSFRRPYRVPTMPAPGSKNGMIDVMAQIDHTHKPVVALPNGKIGRRRDGRSCLFTGFRPFPEMT